MAKARKKNAKIPKRIAGIKVPKAVRKSGQTLTALLDSPAGREILADALIYIAGTLTGPRAVRDAGADARHAAGHAARDAGHVARDAGHGAATLLSEAAGKLAAVVAPSESEAHRDPDRSRTR